MLYVLGGASRSGKTLLARRAVSEYGIPYAPLDALFLALVEGVPSLGVTHDGSVIERSRKMWRISKPFLNFFLEEEKDFLIEGDSILPDQVHELMDQGKSIRCCFFGYTQLKKDEKLALVRRYSQGDTDWTQDVPDEKLLEIMDGMILFSQYLERECAKYGIKFFDVSHDFEAVHAAAFDYLFK